MSDKIGKYSIEEIENGVLKVSGESISDRTVSVPTGECITVNGAWNMESLPNHYIAELADGSLAKFFLNPFRAVSKKDLTIYKSYHPRKCKGQPMPEYLYQFYGLQRNNEVLSETVRLRLSPSEKEKLEAYCENMEPKKNVSELLRDYVRSLI